MNEDENVYATFANKLASAVAVYTPQSPVSAETGKTIRDLASATLAKLADDIDAAIAASTAELGGEEEEVIIITSPRP